MDYQSQNSSADSSLYNLTQDTDDSGSGGEEVDLLDYIDDPWEEDHFNYDQRMDNENNNKKVLSIDKPLWQPEADPLAKFQDPKYEFKPEMFTHANSNKVIKKANAANFPEISTHQFELIGGEEKRLSRLIKFKNVIKYTFQRADALESALMYEENYANE